MNENPAQTTITVIDTIPASEIAAKLKVGSPDVLSGDQFMQFRVAYELSLGSAANIPGLEPENLPTHLQRNYPDMPESQVKSLLAKASEVIKLLE